MYYTVINTMVIWEHEGNVENTSRSHKTKAKVIALDNHKEHMQSKLKEITGSWRTARENACEWTMIGFGFTSDWMKNWREFFKPIV